MKEIFLMILVCTGIFTNVRWNKKKPEILLVGVFHIIPDSLSCNWQTGYEKILRYKPDQLAIEWVQPADTASVLHQFGENYRHIWDSLTIAWEGKMINVTDSINHYNDMLSKHVDEKLRYQLWRYYHLGLDLGNRDYQTYLIHKRMVQTGELPDTTTLIGQAFWSRYKQTLASRKDGEFFRLIFPLAEKLGIHYLHPTDDKVTNPVQSLAWGRFYEKINGTVVQQTIDSFWKVYAAEEKEQLAVCNGLTVINSSAWVKNTDYGQVQIGDRLNDKDFADYKTAWYERNKSIAQNIIASASRYKAKKMAVFYGNMHVFPIKQFLEKEGYIVKLLEDIQ